MFHVANMTSHSNSLSEEASCVSSFGTLNPLVSNLSPIDHQPTQQKIKRKRNLPGNPDPDAEVIALSPKTLMTTNRFVCEICNKGFQRDQNLQLHRRGHNLPWKLKQRNSKDVIKKKAYVCPEPSYWKAHTKTCGTREYRCDCGTLFSRKDSFVTHRAFCDALAEESARLCAANVPILMSPSSHFANNNTTTSSPSSIPTSNNYPFPLLSVPNFFSNGIHQQDHYISFNPSWDPPPQNPTYKTIKAEETNLNNNDLDDHVPSSSPLLYYHDPGFMTSSFRHPPSFAHLSATALLQKAATVGAHSPGQVPSTMSTMDVGCMGGSSVGGGGGVHVSANMSPEYLGNYATMQQKSEGLTRDFLGLTGGERGDHRGNVDVNVNVNVNLRNLLSYTGGVEFPGYNDRDHSLIRARVGFGSDPHGSDTWGNC
ncbi:Protein indeterminate-domain 12 [Heracleum sosnowskyi]|uniref:Protein indeterminate-domain 12 n=1 Tax=Heracleum sosnowskyi TaxID=360622 RepID=A0AAD8GRD3_9APIA|nr:Protein indeterminate-domain 12 [Heracleum sosnowskyi]